MVSALDSENSDVQNDKSKLTFGLIANSNRRVIIPDDKDDDILDYLQDKLKKANNQLHKKEI